MNSNDIIGTAGVSLILLAYLLSTLRMLDPRGRTFYIMNAVGAGLACYASYLINYWPFVILEGTWTLVSIFGLIKSKKSN